jgi:hypothetical protein
VNGEQIEEPMRQSGTSLIFEAGQFWSSNVSGAALGGAGAVILMSVMMGIMVWMNPDRQDILFASTLVLILVSSVLCFLPGNMGAVYPYAITVEEGKGLQLHAPFKRLFIPIDDIRDIQASFLQPGYVVRLNRSHRLLKSFLIPSYFGDQAEPLVNAILEEIQRHASRLSHE